MVNNSSLDTSLDWTITDKTTYKIYRAGSHKTGNFIQIYAPNSPCEQPGGKLKLITYLHGFALCMPFFYENHLIKLVNEGYYVFFPDFQKSDYPDIYQTGKKEVKATKDTAKKAHFSFWSSQLFKLVKDTLLNRDALPVETFLSDDPDEVKRDSHIRVKRIVHGRFKSLRFFLALIAIISVIQVFLSWFNRNYGKNLIDLISTVAWSLLYEPKDWMNQSISLTKQGWEEIVRTNPNLQNKKFDFYVFGHSLGGLLALSWTAFVDPQDNFYPQQIITADPAPSTEMGIPGIAIFILKLFRLPFAIAPINISDTGRKLTVPVGIMHGAADTLVKPKSWIKAPLFQSKSNFDYIVSNRKKIYFSLSNQQHQPPLIAFHNQAVTNTTYYDDALFRNFGGVKECPNAYNFQYVWFGVDQVIKQQSSADQLLPLFQSEERDIQITDSLPPQSFWSTVVKILGIVAVLCLGYWLWNSVLFN